ncbi:uncharacterized protein LOC142498753 [Ascaphus truei]|uniref:uncharacterized protein LOC142498753 n=1 Tax=Ascaphus truei TaxID=8439 RepID=UPI003F59FD64
MEKRSLESDIEKTFQDVYLSLVQNGDHRATEKRSGQKRVHFGGFARSQSCLTVHNSSTTSIKTQEKFTLRLQDSTSFFGNHTYVRDAFSSSGALNTSLQGCRIITREKTQRINVQSVVETSDLGMDNVSRHREFTDQNTDSGVQEDLSCQCTSLGESELFSSQRSNAETEDCDDGASVLSEECPGKRLLCEACCQLHNIVLEDNLASIKKSKVFDPNHWCCDFWMMVNRIPVRGGAHRLTRSLSSTLKALARKLLFSAARRTAAGNGKCSRSHPFLQRNLRLCKKARLRFFNPKPKKHIKRGSSSRKSKAWRGKKASSVDTDQTKEKVKKPYKLIIDSSLAEDTKPDLEGSEPKADVAKRKRLCRIDKASTAVGRQSPSPVSRPMETPASVRKRSSDESAQWRISPSTSQVGGGNLDGSNHSFLIDSVDSDIDLSEYGAPDGTENGNSDPFSWVERGSFRDMLAKLNSGYSKSAAIKEH